MVLCIGPAVLDAAKGGCWFSVGCQTHDYFLRRPKAGRLRPLSKSGPDMIISCGDLRLIGPTRHRKVSKIPSLYYRGLVGGPAARWGGVSKVAPEPSPYMVLRAVWLVTLWLDLVVFQKVAPEPPPCILLLC